MQHRDRRQENILQFFQIVARALHEKLRSQKAPLVLAGVEYLLPLYRQANTYQHLMDEAITGNPEILSAQELHIAFPSLVRYKNPTPNPLPALRERGL